MNSSEYHTQCPVCHSGLIFGYDRIQQLAIEIAHRSNNHLLTDVLAAAYVYIAAILLGFNPTRIELPDLADITEVKIRNRCKDILTSFKITIKVKPVIAKVSR
jgi:transcription initiation factor TFIIB